MSLMPDRKKFDAAPGILAARRQFAAEATRRAIERYHRADAEQAEAEGVEAIDGSDGEKWRVLTFLASMDAQFHLIRTILAWAEDFETGDLHQAEMIPRPPRAVRMGGKLYVATQDPTQYGSTPHPGQVAMHLVVIDAEAVEDMEGIATVSIKAPAPTAVGEPLGEVYTPLVPESTLRGRKSLLACSGVYELGRETRRDLSIPAIVAEMAEEYGDGLTGDDVALWGEDDREGIKLLAIVRCYKGRAPIPLIFD